MAQVTMYCEFYEELQILSRNTNFKKWENIIFENHV